MFYSLMSCKCFRQIEINITIDRDIDCSFMALFCCSAVPDQITLTEFVSLINGQQVFNSGQNIRAVISCSVRFETGHFDP